MARMSISHGSDGLRDKILEGLVSGPSERDHDELFEELRRFANLR